MMLKQRRKGWAEGSDAANDYTVIDERGEKIGRIYRTLVGRGRGYAWNWMVYRGPAGHAPTLEAAQAAFAAAWATCDVLRSLQPGLALKAGSRDRENSRL